VLALLDEIVGRLEQPEHRGHHPPVSVQSKQPAHGQRTNCFAASAWAMIRW